MTALLPAGDQVGPLRARLTAGDWSALVEPAGEGLLALALMLDPTWWREAWCACLAELLRPWWPPLPKKLHIVTVPSTHFARDEATPEYVAQLRAEHIEREAARQRWRHSVYPAHSHQTAAAAQRQSLAPEARAAFDVLGRWLP